MKALLMAGVAGVMSLTFGASAFASYNVGASEHAAKNWRYLAQSMAPRVSERAAEDPQGPTVIASRPVPDTPANRARYGQPLSRAGRMTAPIGD